MPAHFIMRLRASVSPRSARAAACYAVSCCTMIMSYDDHKMRVLYVTCSNAVRSDWIYVDAFNAHCEGHGLMREGDAGLLQRCHGAPVCL